VAEQFRKALTLGSGLRIVHLELAPNRAENINRDSGFETVIAR
jgi:hypothetical protein